jgi:hypothetical protein
LVCDLDLAGVEVDVRPQEAEGLADSAAGSEQEGREVMKSAATALGSLASMRTRPASPGRRER